MGRGAMLFLGGVVVLVLGFAVGRTTAPSPELAAPDHESPSAPPAGEVVRLVARPEVSDRLISIEERLERIEEALGADEPEPATRPEVERIREVMRPVMVEAVHLAEIESYRQRALPELDRLLKLRRTGFAIHGGRTDPEVTRKAVEEIERRRQDLLELETLAELEVFKRWGRSRGLPER